MTDFVPPKPLDEINTMADLYVSLTYMENSSQTTPEVAEARRAAYSARLAELDAAFSDPTNPLVVRLRATPAVNFYNVEPPHFALSYQGHNNRELLTQLSTLYRKLFPAVNFVAPSANRAEPVTRRRIRVGFFSNRMHNMSSVMKDRRGIIQNLPRDKFEVVLLMFTAPNDPFGYTMMNMADETHVLDQPSFDGACTYISDLNLDVAVFCELSFGVRMYALAHCRFAPVQLTTWGHSDTSGISTVDHYVSTALYELPEDEARAHYSEHLVLHKSLCTYYYPPYDVAQRATFSGRSRFYVPPGACIYVVMQTPFKMMRPFFEAAASVLEGDPNGVLVLTSHPNSDQPGENNYVTLTSILTARGRADLCHRIHVLPWLNYMPGQNLIAVGDVFLDSFPFGGCNTSIETLYAGKPVVTLPSAFLSGRFTQGFCAKLGLTADLVASDSDDFVRRAVRLGTDAAYRAEVQARIAAAQSALFFDGESVREWAATLTDLTAPFVAVPSTPAQLGESLVHTVTAFHGALGPLASCVSAVLETAAALGASTATASASASTTASAAGALPLRAHLMQQATVAWAPPAYTTEMTTAPAGAPSVVYTLAVPASTVKALGPSTVPDLRARMVAAGFIVRRSMKYGVCEEFAFLRNSVMCMVYVVDDSVPARKLLLRWFGAENGRGTYLEFPTGGSTKATSKRSGGATVGTGAGASTATTPVAWPDVSEAVVPAMPCLHTAAAKERYVLGVVMGLVGASATVQAFLTQCKAAVASTLWVFTPEGKAVPAVDATFLPMQPSLDAVIAAITGQLQLPANAALRVPITIAVIVPAAMTYTELAPLEAAFTPQRGFKIVRL